MTFYPRKCWLAELMVARNNDKYNNIAAIEGETGSGKSCFGLSLAQHVDRFFGAKNLVFTKPQFYNALRRFKGKRATIFWDECGTSISHRKWLEDEQIRIMQILQGARYRQVNVFFALPDKNMMDKVARRLCHFYVNMIHRGFADVKRVVHTGDDWRPILTPRLGYVYSEMPTAYLHDLFVKAHSEHMDAFINESEELMQFHMEKKRKAIDKTLNPEPSLNEYFERAKLIIPECINTHKLRKSRVIKQGLINRTKVEERLGCDSNTYYKLRPKMLEYIEANPEVLDKLRAERAE